MNINTISYLVADAFHTMRKDIKNELISLGTMLATMILIAVAYIVFQNANKIIELKKNVGSNINAYLDVDISEDEANKIKYKVEEVIGVTGVTYVSTEEAIEYTQKFNPLLLEGIEQEDLSEICQHYLEISFDDAQAVPVIRSELSKISEVEEIDVNPSAAKATRDAKISRTLAITGIILIVEFSVFLMMNTTKLMVYAKRREISIMKYVGAKDNFIKAPFAIQGVITALIAVVITLILVNIIYPIIVANSGGLGQGESYLAYSEFSNYLLILLLIIGCAIGIGGSTASMNRYLDV